MGGRGGYLFQVMGDEDSGESGLGVGERGECREQRFACQQIETGRGFIEQEQGRIGHKGAGDAHPLPLTLGARGDFATFEVRAAK